jgi:uracil-DNA glycosylase
MSAMDVPITWKAILGEALSTPNSHALASYISSQASLGQKNYPRKADWFRALELTPPEAVRVIILGQDPYHGEGQAHGLAFSLPRGIKIPPSLRNIYKELHDDLLIDIPSDGCLDQWAQQGVLLLNSVLTVEEGKAGSHQGYGWEQITDAIIAHLGQSPEPLVFMLWGGFAQKKRALIKNLNHLILEAPHPSPLSAHRGFLGCRHFSKANAFLGDRKINWAIQVIVESPISKA